MILDFPAIEAMQEASEAAGWKCEFRQLDPGRLAARAVLSELNGSSFLHETATQRLSIVAESPANTVTIIVRGSDTGFWVNGIDVEDNTVVVVPACADFQSVSGCGAEALSLHIPERQFQDLSNVMSANPDVRLSSSIEGFEVSSETLHRFRQSIIGVANGGTTSPQSAGGQPDIEQMIIGLLRSMQAGDRHTIASRKMRTQHIVTRTIEFIDAHLGTKLSVVELCRVAGTSLSTLERAFYREMHMTPIAYIKARRLDAVRRLLIKGNPHIPIAQLAQENGISHMGRFAADYRRQFGVLPSADRPI